MRVSVLCIALLITSHLVSPVKLFAQDSLEAKRIDWLLGASVGVPSYDGEMAAELLTLGVHFTQFRVNRLGADLSLGTVPRLLGNGVVTFGARVGVALPLAVAPRVLLLPSGGLSLLGGFGAGGGGGTSGLNAGVAAVLLRGNAIGFRTGVTWHRFRDADGALLLWEVGFVRGQQQR